MGLTKDSGQWKMRG